MKTIVSLILFFSTLTFSQQFTNWLNYTDMKGVNSVFSGDNYFWAASGGGGFNYDFGQGSFKNLNKADGLSGIELTSVTVDQYGKAWFGSNSGIIDVYNPETGFVKSLLDIANSDKITKKINFLFASGDTIYAAFDFGISLINAQTLVFIDTYFKFGTLPSNIKVNSITKSELLYAATESGIAIQKPGTTNLSAPESWDVYPLLAPGLSSNSNKLVFFDNKVVVASQRGISAFDGNNWQALLSEFNNTNVNDLLVKNDTLYILTDFAIHSFSNGNLTLNYDSPTRLKSISYSPVKGLLASSNNGVVSVDDESFIFPDGPAANQFPSMIIDPAGNFWSASGKDNAGKGLYKYDGTQWTTYNAQSYPVMINNDFISVYAAPDNTIYAGNWGQGFIRLKDNDMVRFDTNNTNMVGFPGNTSFLLIGGFGIDSRNNLWVLNVEPADRNTLAMLTPDSTWYFFTIPAEQNRVLNFHDNLIVDQYDTKWFSSDDQGRRGLFYFNENKTYDNLQDDFSGYINTQNGLSNNTINAIALDRRGDIWVGTGLGINIISNINTVLTSNPQLRISSVFSVRQQTINAIAVDPLNQKWVGTNQGLILLNSDGSRLLSAFDTKNSPLLSDKIVSITIDDRTGKVFVGTEAGLSVFETPAIRPAESFDEIFAFPNPFILTGSSQLLTIDGLVRDSDIKILSASGKLVAEFSSPGGRVGYWDGRDDSGNLVNSGIYLIIAFDKDGNSVATGKVAVLRK
jgi:ligand-binding sensor domain-containing protein